MAITLLRHGALPKQYHRRYIGHSDISIDADLFEYEKVKPLANNHYDLVFSSDLLRCKETLQQMGIEHFTTDSRLREMSFKPSFEGKSFAEIESMANFNQDALDSKESWHNFICEEPFESFILRIQSFLKELPKDKEILICTHAGTIMMIHSHFFPETTSTILGYLDYITLR